MPTISVLMSVYNGERFLRKAVESILAQTFEDFEFIIINDGSSDGSSDILEEYASKDPRIILEEQENKGLIFSLNKGIDMARAPLIARMDADDIALPNRFQIQKDHMDQHPDIVALGGAIELIDENDNTFGKVQYPSQNSDMDDYIYNRGSPLAHPAVMMRTETVKSLGGYRDAYKHAEDYDLWLRMHKVGKIDNLQTTILKYREHTQKVSVQNAQTQALVSVIARYAAKSKEDPTQNLKDLSKETLALFNADQNRIKWEVLDIICSGLMLSPSSETITEFEITQDFPEQVSKSAKPIAVRVFLKLLYASFKAKHYKMITHYLSRAFFTSPVATLRLFFEKLF